MHLPTGYYFLGTKWVMYSTKYESGRWASIHDRTGLSEEQARGKFLVEHSHEVDRLMVEAKTKQSKHLLNIIQDGNES